MTGGENRDTIIFNRAFYSWLKNPPQGGEDWKGKVAMKKLFAVLLAFAMLLALSACGEKEKEESDQPQIASPVITRHANLLEKIKSEGVMTVTLSPDFSPMEFVDSAKSGQDRYVGFDVFLAKYIADYIGVDLEIEPMGFDACQSAVYTGAVALSISGYSWTQEREEKYELSDYYHAGDNAVEQILLLREGDAEKFTRAVDFKGIRVGAQSASLQLSLVQEQLPDAETVSVDDINTGVMQLITGDIDALAVEVGNAKMIMEANAGLARCSWQFEIDEKQDGYLILIGKGETELLDEVNKAIAAAKADGMFNTWYNEAVELAKSESAVELTFS